MLTGVILWALICLAATLGVLWTREGSKLGRLSSRVGEWLCNFEWMLIFALSGALVT